MKTFEVSVNPNQLATYGVSSLELYQAIANSNVNVGGDVIERRLAGLCRARHRTD